MNANEALAAVIALNTTGVGYVTSIDFAGGKWTVTYQPNNASAAVTLGGATFPGIGSLPFAARALARGLLAEWGLS
ncbi:MAG TPA: hypothetical protein VKT52_12670 [Ktedonobacterales bacterium]|nr:hypothetical protein [Ktedonobacterales bacterium]